jgi:hypothetical protein
MTALAPRPGRGDFGDERQDMQLAVEIELVRLALSHADAVPKLFRYAEVLGRQISIANTNHITVVPFFTDSTYASASLQAWTPRRSRRPFADVGTD